MTIFSLPLSAAARKLAAAGFLALCSAPALAQSHFGLWTELGAEREISKRFAIEAGAEFRAENDLKTAARWSGSLGASYKLLPWLKAGAAYTYIYSRSLEEAKRNYKKDGVTLNGWNVDHGFWRQRHRAHFDLTGKWEIGRFTLSLRERYQYTHYMAADARRDKYRDVLTPPAGVPEGAWTPPEGSHEYGGEFWGDCEFGTIDAKESKNKHYLRSRLAVEYNIRHCPLTPGASVELNNNLSDGLHLDKKRVMAGVEWKITKKHRLSLDYLFQTGADDDDEGDLHAVKVGYKFKF